MTYVFLIAGGLVFGLLVFLMFRRRVKRGEKMKELEGKTFVCSRCEKAWPAVDAFRRSGLRGDLYACPDDGQKAWR